MVDAAAGTLRKAWRSGIDLQARAGDHPRIASIASLEEAVRERLPSSMMRPADLVEKAMGRMTHAPAIFGPVRIVGITELSPCWRPLLHALAKELPVTWVAGPRPVPPWLDETIVKVERSEAERPEIASVSAATAYHEAIEAMRWARELLASGVARPHEIGIAAAIPADYDDHFLALRADANLDLHFVHGVKVTATRAGQAAAALADVLARGLSQSRMRRLASLAKGLGGAFDALPDGWTRILPSDAPLASTDAWERLLAGLTPDDWPDANSRADELRKIVVLLDKGTPAAPEAGEAVLGGQALNIWRKALRSGPTASIDATIGALKQPDGLEGSVCMAWMPASEIAAAPRRFVRLLGLNSGRWPRGLSEDRLLSDHVIPTDELDPLPVAAADRRDFATILATSATQVVLSRSRRDSEGRLLGRSPLMQGQPKKSYLRRNAIPAHAFSETDRMLARTDEFKATPQAVAATACWRDWRREEITAHDGLVRANHPAVLAVLERVQSASSLKMLLRNPLGFVWKRALHLKAPETSTDPIVLEPLAFGNLVHAILEVALAFDRGVRRTGGRDANADRGSRGDGLDRGGGTVGGGTAGSARALLGADTGRGASACRNGPGIPRRRDPGRPILRRNAVRQGGAEDPSAAAPWTAAPRSKFPGPASASPDTSTVSTSPGTEAAPWCATTRPGKPPKKSIVLGGGARTATLPLRLRRQGASRRCGQSLGVAVLRPRRKGSASRRPGGDARRTLGLPSRGARQPGVRTCGPWPRYRGRPRRSCVRASSESQSRLSPRKEIAATDAPRRRGPVWEAV